MNKHLVSLINENFYAPLETLRSFFHFALDMQEDGESKENSNVIANYGEEDVTIFINGMMLRERNWFTENGFATSTEQVIDEIKNALKEDKKVKLVINSGGGVVSGVSNLADLIYENRDKVSTYATGMAASAAMWVFSAGGERFAEQTTVLGSIGVVTNVFNDENYWKNHGVVWKEVVSENAKNKRPNAQTEEGLKEVQRYLTSLESVFINHVARNLGITRNDVIEKFHQGGLITGADAQTLSFVSGLTSHNLVAIPTEPQADKLANNNIEGVVEMATEKIAEELKAELEASKTALADKDTQLNDLQSSLSEAHASIEALKAEVEVANAKSDTLKEIVAMAYEHNVSKEVALKMVETDSKGEAALVALGSKQSVEATSGVDLDDSKQQANEASDAELELALELSKSLSVGGK